MGRCGSCGQQSSNPKQPPVIGPAVVLGNGTTIPFDSDADAEAYVARKLARGSDPMVLVRAGETLTA